MARPRGRKRTAAEADGPSDAAAEAAATVRPGKRAKATPKPEAEYFPEKRNLEDLWLSAFPIGTEVECPFPPSDKVGIKSVQRENEEIVPMRSMKMAWVPYVPQEDRLSMIDRLKTKIFTLCCTQRRSALKHLKTERVKKFDYCMPYYMPLSPEDDHDTTVDIIYPLEQPDFVGDLVKDEALPEDEKENFKEFLKKKVKERKAELR